MRELNATGFMHNRVRMIVASFLAKHLLIDWRWGEAYFAEKLLDFELGSNNGGWQWAAGCGCDAAPYFRVFNPTLQTKSSTRTSHISANGCQNGSSSAIRRRWSLMKKPAKEPGRIWQGYKGKLSHRLTHDLRGHGRLLRMYPGIGL